MEVNNLSYPKSAITVGKPLISRVSFIPKPEKITLQYFSGPIFLLLIHSRVSQRVKKAFYPEKEVSPSGVASVRHFKLFSYQFCLISYNLRVAQ